MKQERFPNEKEHIYFYLKDDEYGFLSNFYPSVILVNGVSYPTVEHLYQSMKTRDGAIRVWISNAPKPYFAMSMGRQLRPKDGFDRERWEREKNDVMYAGLLAKFKQHQDLRTKLLNTGNAILHENSPTDKYWGAKGKDMLGKLLMRVRDVMSAYDVR